MMARVSYVPERRLTERCRRFRLIAALTGGMAALFAANRAAAQELPPAPTPAASIEWVSGPAKGQLGDVAEVRVAAACHFTDAHGAQLFMEATENPPSGRELGVLICQSAGADSSHWFVVFSYNASGLVRDDEKASLDHEALLESLQRGTAADNEERRSRGWDEIEVVGWRRPPYYDTTTHNLTWSTRIRTIGQSDETINHSVRLLGRGGVMNADLVASPEQMEEAVAAFDAILTQYTYLPGQRYAEWRAGDRVAEYGLTALIAGGAGAAAAKAGLFGKLWKLILVSFMALKKVVIIAVVAVGGVLRRLFSRREAKPIGT